jgi:hypothetical protein
MKKQYILLFFLVGFGLLAGLAGYTVTNLYGRKKEVCLTVFVHGSVYTMLSALDPQRVWSGALPKQSPYVDMVKRVRKNSLVWQDQVMLKEGWVPFPHSAIDNFHQKKLEGESAQQAAYQFVPSYHTFTQLHTHDQDQVYFLFGHLGLLCQQYRADAGAELYQHICDTVVELKKQYKNVHVRVVTHSHGGNIALNLARAEHQYNRNLVVDDLIMYGAPIQVETAVYAYDPVFVRVINCYSEGDSIQSNDRFSTKQHISYKRFYDDQLEIDRPETTTKIYDVRLLVNNNAHRIGHSNMWQLGRESKATECLDPLPIAVLTPILLAHLDEQLYDGHFDFNIIDETGTLRTELSEHHTKNLLIASNNMYEQASQLQQLTQNNWAPVDKSRMLLFNYQTGATLWQAFQDWRMGVDVDKVEVKSAK